MYKKNSLLPDLQISILSLLLICLFCSFVVCLTVAHHNSFVHTCIYLEGEHVWRRESYQMLYPSITCELLTQDICFNCGSPGVPFVFITVFNSCITVYGPFNMLVLERYQSTSINTLHSWPMFCSVCGAPWKLGNAILKE